MFQVSGSASRSCCNPNFRPRSKPNLQVIPKALAYATQSNRCIDRGNLQPMT